MLLMVSFFSIFPDRISITSRGKMGGGSVMKDTISFVLKKFNKGVTLHILDVLVTQHAKWTAKRVRCGLFGQAIVDFSIDSWSSIQLKESAKSNASQSVTKQAKKMPRVLRSYAQARIQDKYQRQEVSCTRAMILLRCRLWFQECLSTNFPKRQTRSIKLLGTRSPWFSIVRCHATWWAFSIVHFHSRAISYLDLFG